MSLESQLESLKSAPPLTLDGSPILHQMFKINWNTWRRLSADTQRDIAHEASVALVDLKNTGLFAMLGHKGDLMFVHFRETFDQLHQAQSHVARLRLSEFLEPSTSYVSVVELGLYDSTVKLHASATEK